MTARESGASDRPDTVVGRYRLLRRLGSGSFATVWLGRDDDLDVAVAVKVLSPQWADDVDVRQRFVTEARLMRRIRDVRITHVYDIGQLEDGRPYFVMDFADGGSLNDVRRSHPSPVRALRLCAETCRAIAVLHEYDVVHRDVTPGNVLLSRDQNIGTRIMIADLGVANDRAAAIGLPMTAGTPGYMSPEQARGEHVDHRADIYALAALCYAMLTGRPPFGAKSLEDVLGRESDATLDPVAERIGAPPLLDTLLAAGLSTDPQRRPPTAGLLGETLDRIADDLAERLAAGRRKQTDGRAGRPGDESGDESDDDSANDSGDDTGHGEGRGTQRGSGYDGGSEAMATMIRPAGVLTAAPGGEPAAPSADAATDLEADAVPTADDDEPVALPYPFSRYVLLTALGLAIFTLLTLLGLLALR